MIHPICIGYARLKAEKGQASAAQSKEVLRCVDEIEAGTPQRPNSLCGTGHGLETAAVSAFNGPVTGDGRAWFKLAGLAFMVAGCARTATMQDPGTQVASRRLAALPSEVVVWDWDFYGTKTVAKDDSLKAKRNIDDSITYRLRRYGGRSFGAASVEGLEHGQAFRSWAVDALTEIMAERLAPFEPQRPHHATVGDFRFSNSLESWRSPLDADFVLITLFLDGRNSPGRELGVAMGGGALAARRAIACVVQLRSGRVVWCNLDTSVQGTLMLRWGAQKEVDMLLREMLSKGQTAGSEPRPAPSTAAQIAPADDVPPPPPPPPPAPPARGPDDPAAAPANFHAAPTPNVGPS